MKIGHPPSDQVPNLTRSKKEEYRVNPDIPVKAVQDQLQHELEVQIFMSKAFRAKAKGEREIRGDHKWITNRSLRDQRKTNMHLLLNTSQREELENELTSREELAALQVEFADMEGRAKSDLLLNNICEVFNGKIVEGRDKPVITLLEYIREYCMKRIMNVQGVIDKCTGPLTPTATRIMESIKKEAHLMKVQWNGANKNQVSGIPCKHAVAACWNMAEGSGSASRQAQQTEPAVGQDGKGRPGAGAVIGLSIAAGEGGAGDPGVANQGSSHTSSQVSVSQIRNADGREMGDDVPTQSSAAGGASEWSFM
ncbi:hypothetical protein Tco_1177667 [Tanacetum coccineum]